MPANQHHALVPLHGHGPFLQWQASRASVGAGHARERSQRPDVRLSAKMPTCPFC